MSARSVLRAAPTVLRVGLAEAVAYRAELLVWVLTTTMPFVMLAIFSAAAIDGPIGRYGQTELAAYFLATFVVRQITGSWAGWQINVDVREGTLATRMLRPLHPLVAYALEHAAAIPMRALAAAPVVVILLATSARAGLSRDPVSWLLLVVSLALAWLLTIFINFAIGCLAFFIDSSQRVLEVYLAVFFVASGYLVPLDVFPPAARRVLELMPFRHQVALPVEIFVGRYDGRAAALAVELAQQAGWTLVALGLVALAWTRGVRRYGAFGG